MLTLLISLLLLSSAHAQSTTQGGPTPTTPHPATPPPVSTPPVSVSLPIPTITGGGGDTTTGGGGGGVTSPSGVSGSATLTGTVTGTDTAGLPANGTLSGTDTVLPSGVNGTAPPPMTTPFAITASTTEAIAPIPTSSLSSTPNQSTIDSSDHQIQYAGDWQPVKSSCDSEVMAMQSSQLNSYFTFQFKVLQGGALYLDSTRDPSAGLFIVLLDNLQSKLDGYSATPENSCSFTFSQTSLQAGFHNLTVVFDGPSPQAPSGSAGTLQLNGIQLTGQDFHTSGAVSLKCFKTSVVSGLISVFMAMGWLF